MDLKVDGFEKKTTLKRNLHVVKAESGLSFVPAQLTLFARAPQTPFPEELCLEWRSLDAPTAIQTANR